jgi:hypothetical protein
MRHARLEYASFFLAEIGQGSKFKPEKNISRKGAKAQRREDAKVLSINLS